MHYIIGVDGGGTKTLALLAGLDGQVIARGVSGPSNYNAVGFEKACSSLETAISTVRKDYPGDIVALCLGLAGAGRREDIERFQSWAQNKFPGTIVKVVNDAEILLAAGSLTGPTLALVCGTGSFVYGRTRTGEMIRAGGWGYLFGDEGSGYAIGAAALRAVMKSYDGRGPSTVLTELILKKRELSSPQDLVHHIYGAESPRLEVASLSELVEEAAERNDAVAIFILEDAARELVKCLAVVYPKLGESDIPLVISGGTILNGRHLMAAFRRSCENLNLVFTTIYSVVHPAEVAVQLARKLLSG
jgi:N-acetylmuramic acid 6-phosphate etherase